MMDGVCCERLMCAACAGHVVDARCAVCAAAKARVHGDVLAVRVPEWLAVLAVLLVTLALLLAVHAR
jgi:hypothetical protein